MVTKNLLRYILRIILPLMIVICLVGWAGATTQRTAQAGGTVGNGTVGSCTESAFETALTGGGTITFNCGAATATVPITSRKTITANTTLDGANSPTAVTLDGYSSPNTAIGMFYIGNGATFSANGLIFQNGKSTGQGAAIYADANATLNLTNVTFNNNISTDSSATNGGGAIFLAGATGTIVSSTFSSNKAPSGGAINSYDSVLSVSGSTFNGNEASASDGGAIYTHSSNSATLLSSLSLDNSRLTTNVAKVQGGGLSIYYSPDAAKRVTINNTTIANNSAGVNTPTGFGGGIYNGQGSLNIQNSLISGNGTPFQGGGLWTGNTGSIKLSNVTIFNNNAYNSNGQGGGIFWSGSQLRLVNSTIASNQSGNTGGGIDTGGVSNSSGIHLANTIIANNKSTNSSYYSNCSGTVTDEGHNLQWLATTNALFSCNDTITKADPKLAGLSDAGGPTQTVGLLAGSPALDGGDDGVCSTAQPDGAGGIDQRGQARPIGSHCDIGAFEGVIAPPTLAKAFVPSTIALGGTTSLVFTIGNPGSAGVVLSGISFSDSLPGSLKVAASPGIVNNCNSGSSLNVTNNGSVISVLGVSLPAGQTCTFAINVTSQATAAGSVTNSVTTISAAATGFSTVNALATLTVTNNVPYNLVVSLDGANHVGLTWRDDVGNRQSTRIERSPGDTAHFALIGTVGPGQTSYLDTTTTEATLYYYRVQAVTSGGTPTPYSNYASLTTLLNPPSALSATVASSTGVNLTWTNNSTKQTGFHLERKTGSTGAWTVISDTTSLSYSDTGLTPGTIYYYRVRAFNADLVSPYSNEASLITLSNLVVTNATETGNDGGTAGTLLYALNQANSITNPTITFQVSTVNVQAGVVLPAVPVGVTVGGGCGLAGPTVIIQGTALRLGGNNLLYGLHIKAGSSAGPFLSNLAGSPPATNNRLICIVVGRQ